MEKKKNTPKLRFPEFTGEWEEKKIQKLIDDKIIISHLDGNHGGLYPRNEEFVSNGIPYITANDFAEGILYFDKCKFLTNERASKFRKGIAINGDVLFAHNATVGPTAILRTNFDYVILSTTATYFRCDNINLLNLYVEKYFNTDFFVNQYTRVMAQSTRNQVPISMQRTFSIKLPTIGEQTKIATFLTAVDEKLTQLKKKKTLLEQYKKGVMQKLFSQELRFKDDNNQDFPDWQEKTLGEISKNVMYGMNSSAIAYDGINKYLRITDIDEDSRKFIPNPLTSPEGDIENKYKLNEGDLVFARTGASVGKSYLYNKSDGNLLFAGFLIRFAIQKENPYFIYLQTIQDSFKKWVQLMSMRSGQPGINAEEYKTLILDIPSLPEQQKIATFLSAIDEKINHCSAKIEKMETWKKGLLQQMFC